LVSHRDLLRLLSKGLLNQVPRTVTVSEVMRRDPITVAPETPTLEALGIMQRSKVGCLPVVENGKLVGIVTAYDFLTLSAEIIEKQLKNATNDRGTADRDKIAGEPHNGPPLPPSNFSKPENPLSKTDPL